VSVRCLYLDLDGTLLGRGASLLHGGDGTVSIAGVRAIEACLRAQVEVVVMSGRRRAATFAAGDSREDLACAAHVGVFWLVANAVERDPTIRELLAAYDNARVAGEGYGAGVYEAVVSTLMQER
jgi:hydroxymethylpyrimidine pyrophosphatase-like HAD family hydrolase